jgi:oligo-1,6-glucosidase
MQWDASPAAGFTTGTPWLRVNPNHAWLNAEAQRSDPTSVLNHYKALITLRHTEPLVVDGDFRLLLPDHPSVHAFERSLGNERLAVYANLSGDPVDDVLPPGWEEWDLVLANLPDPTDATPGSTSGSTLGPWEARVYRLHDPSRSG